MGGLLHTEDSEDEQLLSDRCSWGIPLPHAFQCISVTTVGGKYDMHDGFFHCSASYQLLVQRVYFFSEGEALEDSGTREARERKYAAVEIEFGGRRPVAEDNPP